MQSALTSALIVGAFLTWLVVGASLNKRHQEPLPTVIHNCHLATNQTGLNIIQAHDYGIGMNDTAYEAKDLINTTPMYQMSTESEHDTGSE